LLDHDTTRALLQFRTEREWEQFHTPLNLAIAISVEAGELLEPFQWMRSTDNAITGEQRTAIEHEIADVAMLLFYLASDLGINVDKAVRDKLAINADRYPVETAKGSGRKYDRL
jgi:NTP pyrophosphatase (non-canonical NTP hydrolase)